MRVLRIVVLVVLLLAAYPAWLGWQIWTQSHNDENRSADAIVVLGAAQYDGRPSRVFEARLAQAAYLYDEGFAPSVIVTGGKQEGDRFTEAEAGETYLVEEEGLPGDDVVDVSEGRTTLESLEAVHDVAGAERIESILLVSDPLHSERIKRIAHDLGFEDAYASFANYERLNRSRTTKVRELFHEIAALMAYELLGE